MLRIAEQFHASDLGRQRQGNEDNYFVRAPLFVVADGMGGAQAGEVASGLAAAVLEEATGDEPSHERGEERVASLIQEANRRVFGEAAQSAHKVPPLTRIPAVHTWESYSGLGSQ